MCRTCRAGAETLSAQAEGAAGVDDALPFGRNSVELFGLHSHRLLALRSFGGGAHLNCVPVSCCFALPEGLPAPCAAACEVGHTQVWGVRAEAKTLPAEEVCAEDVDLVRGQCRARAAQCALPIRLRLSIAGAI